MTVTDLISDDIPYLSPLETVKKARRVMRDGKYEHLPVVSEGGEYVGLASETEVSDANPSALVESVCGASPFVGSSQDIYSVIGAMSQFHYSVLPVVDESHMYLGSITRTSLIDGMAQMTSAQVPGGVIEIETDARNFSTAVISNVAEYNSMKVMSLLSHPNGSHGIRAVLKLNGTETSSVIQGLERNGYQVHNVQNGDSKYSDMLEEHYDALIKYLEV